MRIKKREVGAVGKFEEYAGLYPVKNTIKANGATLSRALFWRLWQHAQASGNLVDESVKDRGNYGTGDGSTTFSIPDRRGVAARGYDDGAGLDSDPSLGRYQADNNKEHVHAVHNGGYHAHSFAGTHTSQSPILWSDGRFGLIDTGGGPGRGGIHGGGEHAHGMSQEGATESTMKNVSVLVCIRYQ